MSGVGFGDSNEKQGLTLVFVFNCSLASETCTVRLVAASSKNDTYTLLWEHHSLLNMHHCKRVVIYGYTNEPPAPS